MTTFTAATMLGVHPPAEGTVNPDGFSVDPEVLRLRLAIVFEKQQRKLDLFGFRTREEAQTACGRGEFVFERHGLAAFFIQVRATGEMRRAR